MFEVKKVFCNFAVEIKKTTFNKEKEDKHQPQKFRKMDKRKQRIAEFINSI